MHIYDKKIILSYTTLVILWWLCIWGLFEEFIHFVANKKVINKVLIYVSIACIIIGITYHNPDTLDHF
jgi:hypothetical protein